MLAEELDEIERIVRARPGITSPEVGDALGEKIPRRTLQYRLKRLVDDGRLIREGGDRVARYRTPEAPTPAPAEAVGAAAGAAAAEAEAAVTLSREGEEIRAQIRQPLAARAPVGYNRNFLDSYRPGETFYLPERARTHLAEVGARHVG